MSKFIGRESEIAKLQEFTQKKSASFILVRGRRRIGKSRLIKEFSKSFKNFYSFSGLAPDKKTTNLHQPCSLDEAKRNPGKTKPGFRFASSRLQGWIILRTSLTLENFWNKAGVRDQGPGSLDIGIIISHPPIPSP